MSPVTTWGASRATSWNVDLSIPAENSGFQMRCMCM